MKFVDKLTFNNETYEIRDSVARDILTQQGENIAEIDGRQQVMRSEINSLQTRMGQAETDILNNTADISDIEDAIDEMDINIENNTSRITDLEARVDECEDINTAQQVEINNIKNRVTTAEGNITVINSNISDINSSLDAIAAVDTQQTAQINQNKADITTLKNRANAADSRMDGIDTTIADLDDRIVASTYEAGEGIYFGQGEEHTNINVEDELLDEIHQNTQDVADLKDRVDNLEDRVDDVEDDIDNIQGDIVIIQGDITSIQGDITTIQGDVSDMQTIVNNISNTVTNIQAEIAVHDEDINKLKESAKYNVITVEYAPVGGVWTYTAKDTAATILRYIEEYKAKSATAQSDYIDHKDIVVNVSQGPYSYPDMIGIINNYSKPLYIYETSVDYVVCFINNTNWRSSFNNDDYELVSLIITTGQTPTITFATYNWNAKLQTLSQAVASMTAQVNANTNAINSIGNTLTTMQTNITSMQGDITTIQGNITNINSDITNINGDIATAQGDITQLQSDMTTAQGDITQLQSDVTDIDKRTHVHKIPLVITSTGDPPTFTTPITTTQFNDIISDYNSNGGQIIAVITDGTSSSNPPYEGNCNLISIEGYNTGDVSGTVGNHYMIFETCDNDHYSQKYYITLFTRIGPGFPDVVNIDVKTVDPFADFVNVTSPTDLARLYNIVTATDFSTMKQYTHIPLIYFNAGTIWQDTMGIIERNVTTVKITYKRGENISQYGLEEYTLYQITMTGASTYTTNTINLSNDASVIKYYQELCGISRNVSGTTRDLNAIIEPGRWNVDTSASTTNNGFPSDVDPTQINHWTLENTSSVVQFGFVSDYTTITQILTIKDNPGVMYRRARNSNTWGPWYKFTGTVVT